jgi:hypothetical protein
VRSCSAAEEDADGQLSVLADLWQPAAAPASSSPSALPSTSPSSASSQLQTSRIEAHDLRCTGNPAVADSDDEAEAAADTLPVRSDRFGSAPWTSPAPVGTGVTASAEPTLADVVGEQAAPAGTTDAGVDAHAKFTRRISVDDLHAVATELERIRSMSDGSAASAVAGGIAGVMGVASAGADGITTVLGNAFDGGSDRPLPPSRPESRPLPALAEGGSGPGPSRSFAATPAMPSATAGAGPGSPLRSFDIELESVGPTWRWAEVAPNAASIVSCCVHSPDVCRSVSPLRR